jgi:uncharacterized protein
MRQRQATDSHILIYQSYEQDDLPGLLATGQCDCDCACVSSGLSIGESEQFKPSVPYRLHPELSLFPIESGYWAAVTPISLGPVVLNGKTLALLREFESAKTVQDIPALGKQKQSRQEFMTILIALSILVPVGHPLTPSLRCDHVLSAWLHITNMCNMNCSYCYVHKTNENMSLELGQAAIAAVVRSALANGLKGIRLKYAGGEPMLRFPLVLELHRYAQDLSTRHGLDLDGVVLSNGSLLDKSVIARLKALGLRLMVSMDNIDASPGDNQRVFPNGQDSGYRVALAIDKSLELGLVPDVTVTVTRHNLSGLPTLVEWLLARDLPFSLNYYRDNGRISSGLRLSLRYQEEEFIATMQHVFSVARENLSGRSLVGSLVDHSNLALPHLYPCGVGHNYLVIDHWGNVAKCQMDMQHLVTTISVDDPLTAISIDRGGLQNPSVLQKDTCSKCEWRYWCAGGCPLLTYRTTGRYDSHSPYCHIYRRLYPEVARLEALRLLSGGVGSKVVQMEVGNNGDRDRVQ